MSKYKQEPLEFDRLTTVPIAERGGKVTLEHMGSVHRGGGSMTEWLARLPKLLAADELRGVVAAMQSARRQKRAMLWGLGGHVIKCGLAPLLADLMERGYASGFVMNGAAAIHDFELGMAGCTSEDVESVLPDGRFGSAEETGREMNEAIAQARRDGVGIGEALGARLHQLVPETNAAACLLLQAWRRGVPVTVHVAIGTDTPHTHPQADGAALGAGSHYDFRLFCSLLRELNAGGVYLNVGSAVILPEVFLKGVSVVRNLGFPLADFSTVNFDFFQHYRPRVNVVGRPHAQRGGRGYAITGHHEILIPLLAALLIESES